MKKKCVAREAGAQSSLLTKCESVEFKRVERETFWHVFEAPRSATNLCLSVHFWHIFLYDVDPMVVVCDCPHLTYSQAELIYYSHSLGKFSIAV